MSKSRVITRLLRGLLTIGAGDSPRDCLIFQGKIQVITRALLGFHINFVDEMDHPSICKQVYNDFFVVYLRL